MKLILSFALIAVATKQANAQCSLCGAADASFNAEKELMGVEGITCAALSEQLSQLPEGEMCDGGKGLMPIDLASYCECAGTTPPNTCKVCGDNQNINSAAVAQDGVTCGQGLDFAKYITNATMCAESFQTEEVKKTCCVDKEGASSGIDLSISSLVAALIAGLAFTI